MKSNRIVLVAFLLVVAGVVPALADATVEQHTKTKFGGALGRMMNFFAGKAAKEGVDSTDVVQGDRRASISGDNGDIVDLAEEKVYRVDYRRKTYTMTTFDEMRRQFEEAQENAKKAQPEQAVAEPEKKGPEYQIDVDVKETGAHETIAGFDTRQVIVTVTIHEKGKKLEESGGSVLTSDLWLGPRVPALEELWKFEMRFARQLWGDAVPGMDMQAMAQLLAAAPMFADAMKVMTEKRGSLDGTPIRTNLTFEGVPAPGQPAEGGSTASPATPSGVAGKMIGGLLSRRKKSEDTGETKRSMLFTSANEIRRADLSAESSKLVVPAGFKLKK